LALAWVGLGEGDGGARVEGGAFGFGGVHFGCFAVIGVAVLLKVCLALLPRLMSTVPVRVTSERAIT
jgi:hypothetical protein